MATLKEVVAFILSCSDSDMVMVERARDLRNVVGSSEGRQEPVKPSRQSGKSEDLESLRTAANMTRAAVAELAEVSQATVYNAERHADKVADETIEMLKQVCRDAMSKK